MKNKKEEKAPEPKKEKPVDNRLLCQFGGLCSISNDPEKLVGQCIKCKKEYSEEELANKKHY